ncbi:MAG: hypothetical protein H7Z41_13095 [Cytophagales bacterium]|nr:hypothetical protein [Armatimonadota bacterium]
MSDLNNPNAFEDPGGVDDPRLLVRGPSQTPWRLRTWLLRIGISLAVAAHLLKH